MQSHPDSRAGPIESLRFSTAQSGDPAQALRLLNERKAVLPLSPLAGRAPHADIVQWPYPRLGILSATLCGLWHGVDAKTLARAVTEDHLYLGIPRAGTSVAEQRGDELTLRDGDAVLLWAAEGFRMTHPERVNFLGLRLSRTFLAPHVGSIDDVVMRPIRRDSPALGLLTRYVDLALDESLPAASELGELVVSHVYELAALAIGASRDSALIANGFGVRAARLRAIKADIMARISDSTLSVSAIADRHHVTPRYVHRLFAYEGTTYSEFVLAQRLARVHRRLTDPRYAGESISALAFQTGFGDLSHFNRSFRRRFNATPSDVRRRLR